nr:leucine-rich repeat-containing protein 43-like [Labrus bergylta]
MSSNTLSAVLKKLIQRLCLEDFPCGYGSWRATNSKGAETEETDALLDMLSCSHSPWRVDASWSPQASALRRIAVLTPERLSTDFVYRYFSTLRVVDKEVSVIDDGLLRFSKLEELVLSANRISQIPAENLPSTLKILELCANEVSALSGLTRRPPPRLQYLGLGANRLGSHDDASHLTGRHWPQLVCLDLSDCEFQDQRALLSALSTLPCLRTLVLQGNPFTLASCYPGLTVDSLPQLSCLDAVWISSEERRRHRGLTDVRDLKVEQASATVSVGRMRGIPDPMMGVDENAPEFPVITCRYHISYDSFSQQAPVTPTSDIEPKFVTENISSDADLPSNQNCAKEKESSTQMDADDPMVHTEETHASRCSTSKLPWAECVDFSDTQTHAVGDLSRFKRFLKQGLYLRIEEEKVLSWPPPSEDVTAAKPNPADKVKKGGKGKETPNKAGSNKDKSKDKKKKSAQDLIHDAPVTRFLASVHVPLLNLLKTGQTIDVLCEFGVLHTESESGAALTYKKDLGKKTKEDKNKDEKEAKQRGGSSTRQKNSAASKGRGKGRKESETDDQQEPVTVELRVELVRWRSASEAQHALTSHQNS